MPVTNPLIVNTEQPGTKATTTTKARARTIAGKTAAVVMVATAGVATLAVAWSIGFAQGHSQGPERPQYVYLEMPEDLQRELDADPNATIPLPDSDALPYRGGWSIDFAPGDDITWGSGDTAIAS